MGNWSDDNVDNVDTQQLEQFQQASTQLGGPKGEGVTHPGTSRLQSQPQTVMQSQQT